MTIKIASLTANTAAEREGQWIDIKEWTGLDPDMPWKVTKTPGLRFHVRSMNDPRYRVARQKWIEEVEEKQKAAPDGILDPDYLEAGEGRLLSDCLLLGWEGLDETYTPAFAADLLPQPSARPFREMITFCAAKVGKRKVEFVEAAAKN